jgi:hypothetical protein
MFHQCLNLVTVNQPADEYHRQEYQYKNPKPISVEIIFVHFYEAKAIVQQINDLQRNSTLHKALQNVTSAFFSGNN